MALTTWDPTPVELMHGMMAVLTDPHQHSDAYFVHGAPARDDKLDDKLLAVAVQAYNEGLTPKIVLNGLAEKECQEQNLAYTGWETWDSKLRAQGVGPQDILILPASPHTGTESRNLLTMAKDQGWTRLTISSYPYHQLRCFLTIIALMEETGTRPLVYNRTFHAIDWRGILRKPVLDGTTVTGGGDIAGRLPNHIQGEYDRIVTYAQDPALTGKNYTRHATIPEMLEHLKSRVSLIELQDIWSEGKTPHEDWDLVP